MNHDEEDEELEELVCHLKKLLDRGTGMKTFEVAEVFQWMSELQDVKDELRAANERLLAHEYLLAHTGTAASFRFPAMRHSIDLVCRGEKYAWLVRDEIGNSVQRDGVGVFNSPIDAYLTGVKWKLFPEPEALHEANTTQENDHAQANPNETQAP
jgi:hypothetical protein